MTDLLDMDPGRELDARVAAAVFGWRWFRHLKRNLVGLWGPDPAQRRNWAAELYEDVTGREASFERFTDWDCLGYGPPSTPLARYVLPAYSTDPAATRLVLDWLRARYDRVDLRYRGPGVHLSLKVPRDARDTRTRCKGWSGCGATDGWVLCIGAVLAAMTLPDKVKEKKPCLIR